MAGYTLTCNIQILPWDTAQQDAQSIRRIVFIQEQAVTESLEWDGMDEDAKHAVALNNDGVLVGYARLLPSKQLGRMAVLAKYRKKGIGTALLLALEEEASRLHYDHIFLHAQIQALPFYEQQGYVGHGEPFDEAGIPHLMMTKLLTDIS